MRLTLKIPQGSYHIKDTNLCNGKKKPNHQQKGI